MLNPKWEKTKKDTQTPTLQYVNSVVVRETQGGGPQGSISQIFSRLIRANFPYSMKALVGCLPHEHLCWSSGWFFQTQMETASVSFRELSLLSYLPLSFFLLLSHSETPLQILNVIKDLTFVHFSNLLYVLPTALERITLLSLQLRKHRECLWLTKILMLITAGARIHTQVSKLSIPMCHPHTWFSLSSIIGKVHPLHWTTSQAFNILVTILSQLLPKLPKGKIWTKSSFFF